MLEKDTGTVQKKSIAAANYDSRSYTSAATDVQQMQSVENSPSTVQSPIQRLVNNSPQVLQAKANQELANESPQSEEAIQLYKIANGSGAGDEGEETPATNDTGLPNDLKAGLEKLSGYSLDDVKVHRNSSKPAQFQAHAYAQGTDIHLGAGQEKHLAHEAWHVVQQKQGKVQPTRQVEGNVNVNDDAGLEKEADVMGLKAASMGGADKTNDAKGDSDSLKSTQAGSGTIQLMSDEERANFYNLKARYHNELKQSVNAGVPKQDRRVCPAAVEQFWLEITQQYSAGSFSQERSDEFNDRADNLRNLVNTEMAAAGAVQVDLDVYLALDTQGNVAGDSKADVDYKALVNGFNANIKNGTVGMNQATMQETIAWLTTHTAEREYVDERIDSAGGEGIDIRQWQQYQLDVKNALAGDANATEIFDAFEAQNPGWLGGQGIERLEEQLENAMEYLELTQGWTAELEASVDLVFAAFAEQSSQEKQDERNAVLDAEDAAILLATQQAEKAAKSQAVLDKRPQLSGRFIGVNWSQWGGPEGFQIPKCFTLVGAGDIHVYFQPNQDVTAKHLREFLDQEKGANRTADGPRALAYLEAMQVEFEQLGTGDIKDNGKARPGDWEFLFKADEDGNKDRRTCYHIVPKSGPFHT